jgi:hypothetical protein
MDMQCVLWGTNWVSEYCLDENQVSKVQLVIRLLHELHGNVKEAELCTCVYSIYLFILFIYRL